MKEFNDLNPLSIFNQTKIINHEIQNQTAISKTGVLLSAQRGTLPRQQQSLYLGFRRIGY
jgi:hypothetical protein